MAAYAMVLKYRAITIYYTALLGNRRVKMIAHSMNTIKIKLYLEAYINKVSKGSRTQYYSAEFLSIHYYRGVDS